MVAMRYALVLAVVLSLFVPALAGAHGHLEHAKRRKGVLLNFMRSSTNTAFVQRRESNVQDAVACVLAAVEKDGKELHRNSAPSLRK